NVLKAGPNRLITWRLDSTPNTTFKIDFYANTARDRSGFGEGERLLLSLPVLTDKNGSATWVLSFPDRDTFISATATDPQGNTSEFSMVDTDGDALADEWEIRGIDFDEDGTVDLTLPGARPERRDVYVEIDAMDLLAPSQEELDRVVLAF